MMCSRWEALPLGAALQEGFRLVGVHKDNDLLRFVADRGYRPEKTQELT